MREKPCLCPKESKERNKKSMVEVRTRSSFIVFVYENGSWHCSLFDLLLSPVPAAALSLLEITGAAHIRVSALCSSRESSSQE